MSAIKADATGKPDKKPKLPELVDGEFATVTRVSLVTCKTREPKPYTEGLLIEDLQSAAKFVDSPELRKVLRQTDVAGIGTAATRAETIEKLKSAKYIRTAGKTIVATQKGIDFVNWLDSIMPELTDVALTARWQAELDSVAVSGGGLAFEARVAEHVRKLVATFKVAPPLRSASTSSSESTSMTDTPRENKPTDKMLEFAKRIATKLGIPVTDEVMVDYDACKAFIDLNKEASMRPSEKQINFANRIAKENNVTVPEDALKDGMVLSRWIDENKS